PCRCAFALHTPRGRRSRGGDADHHTALVHDHGTRDEGAEGYAKLIVRRREAYDAPLSASRCAPSTKARPMSRKTEGCGCASRSRGVQGESEEASRRCGWGRLCR